MRATDTPDMTQIYALFSINNDFKSLLNKSSITHFNKL